VTDPVLRCSDHGFVTAPECPACGADDEELLSGDRRRRLSKFLSGALRHFPGDAGIELDERGWTDYDDLAAAATRKYGWARPEHVAAVVETDPKGRYERSGSRIRAAYGHSVDVSLDADGEAVPDRLYHGTAPGNVDAILSEGLRPMNRREVHLSETPAAAREVGSRHAPDPVVFEVDAEAMVADDRRVTRRGEGVYTADEVPPAYLGVRRDSRGL
jgi:putative RNA 2'-phosphotransferase